jgi:TetR/AcrR family transcriptional repressor of nem operon
MTSAGLTHGGFYRHFRDKEQLITEALCGTGDDSVRMIRQAVSVGGLDAAVDSYLSTSQRDAPTPVCPFAALGSELARSGASSKAAAMEALEKMIATLAGGKAETEERYGAILTFATMVGAMTLARIASNTPLSDEILDLTKAHLHEKP